MLHGGRALAPLWMLVFLATACGSSSTGTVTQSPAPLPSGFTRSSDRELGFEIGLAPGWGVSRQDSESISYGGPEGATMVVSVEQAASSDLDSASTVVFSELTGGSPGRARVTAGHLGGRSAEYLSTELSAGGASQHVEAYVTVDGHRAWEVAVEAPEQSAASASGPFRQMAGTFRLVGVQPTPPARAAVGLPAPQFSELDRISGPVIINFFATWCADCRTDMPQIARAAMGNQGRVTLLGVDCCSDRSSDVPVFLHQLGVQNAFHDVTYDNDRRIAASYGLLGPPTTAFLDKDHVLRELVAGPVTSGNLQQGLREAEVS